MSESERKLPTRDQLAELPRWARLALVARCLIRIEPVFLQSWRDAPHEALEVIRSAVELTRDTAARGELSERELYSRLSNQAYKLSTRASDGPVRSPAASEVAGAVAYGVSTALINDEPAEGVGVGAIDVLVMTQSIVRNYFYWDGEEVSRDFETSRALAARSGSEGSGMEQSVFGELWPNGRPRGWPSTELTPIRLPTAAEIKTLVRGARIALAARAAIRVQPLYRRPYQDRQHDIADQMDRLVELMISAATTPDSVDLAGLKHGSGYKAADDQPARDVARFGARAVLHAPQDAEAVERALERSADAASLFLRGRNEAVQAASEDFKYLKQMQRERKWTDSTSMPAAMFEDVWQDDPPRWWPEGGAELRSEPGGLEIELEFPDGTPDHVIIEAIKRAAADASRTHIGLGGSGLKLRDIDIEFEPASVSELLS